MRISRVLATALGVAILLFSSISAATPVHIYLSGHVDIALPNTLSYPFSQVGVVAGTPFEATLVLDSPGTDLLSGDPTLGRYFDTALSFSLTAGQWSVAVDFYNSDVEVVDQNQPTIHDSWIFEGTGTYRETPNVTGGSSPGEYPAMYVTLRDFSAGAILQGDALVPPTDADWEFAALALPHLSLTIDHVIVPEPPAWILLFALFTILGQQVRRTRRI